MLSVPSLTYNTGRCWRLISFSYNFLIFCGCSAHGCRCLLVFLALPPWRSLVQGGNLVHCRSRSMWGPHHVQDSEGACLTCLESVLQDETQRLHPEKLCLGRRRRRAPLRGRSLDGCVL